MAAEMPAVALQLRGLVDDQKARAVVRPDRIAGLGMLQVVRPSRSAEAAFDEAGVPPAAQLVELADEMAELVRVVARHRLERPHHPLHVGVVGVQRHRAFCEVHEGGLVAGGEMQPGDVEQHLRLGAAVGRMKDRRQIAVQPRGRRLALPAGVQEGDIRELPQLLLLEVEVVPGIPAAGVVAGEPAEHDRMRGAAGQPPPEIDQMEEQDRGEAGGGGGELLRCVEERAKRAGVEAEGGNCSLRQMLQRVPVRIPRWMPSCAGSRKHDLELGCS